MWVRRCIQLLLATPKKDTHSFNKARISFKLCQYTYNYYMLETTTIWTVKTVSGCGYTWKIYMFLGLGLIVTEINIKKVQNQKNIRCRDGMPKSMQTR